MSAAHHNLDNLILVLDKNRLQIDGKIEDIMNIDPIDEKYRAFGWHVVEVDGHDMADIVEKFDKARNGNDTGKPTVLICHTNKGRGVSFMENAEWHAKVPNEEEYNLAMGELV